MPSDTGAPWLLPYPEDTDLVRDGADDIEALAVATAAGLSIAGGLVVVKSAIFTGTQTNSTAAGANFEVTDLTITHAVADAANKLIISAFLGVAANSAGAGQVGIAINDGTNLIGVGAAAGSRPQVSAGGGAAASVTMPSITFVHTPGTGSKTYTVRAINIRDETQTVFINRRQVDNDDANSSRAISSLVIQEVRV